MHQHTEIRDLSLKLLVVSVTFLAFQGVFAYLTSSLVLWTDTFHLLSDSLVLLIALFTQILVGRGCEEEKDAQTYHLLETRATIGVGLLLVLGGAFLLYEACTRFADPPNISPLILIPGVLGLGANLAMIKLAKSQGSHLTVKGMLAHFKADSLGSVGVICTAVLIWVTNQPLVDPIISILVVTQIFRLAFNLILATRTPNHNH